MEQTPLVAQNRTVLGKKVKTLRKEGLIPAHVFGNQIETTHVQVKASDFAKVYEKVGETGIIALTIDGKQKPVMVRDTQVNPVSDDLYHIDFYQVNLSEKVKVNVPLEIVGESPTVEKKIGLLLTPITEVEVEALPGDLPENIEIDISGLINIDDEIKVKDLKVDRSKIEIITDEELVVAQIGELVTKEMEELEAEVEAEAAETVAAEAAAEAPAEGETTEGETPAEGEAAGGEPRPQGREKAEAPKEEKSE